MLDVVSPSKIRFAEVAEWMDRYALPYWASTGYDEHRQVCRERLALNGAVADPEFRRTRALARQVYVYSHAQLMGWNGPATKVAKTTLDYMVKHCWQGRDKGWVRRVDVDGKVMDATPDLYDQAFALFALGWRYRATSEDAHLDLADETLDFVVQHMRAPDGLGYLEEVPTVSRARCQNPHMHLLEALIVLAQSGRSDRYLKLATEIVDLYETRVVDASNGALREFFGPGWTMQDTPEGHVTEPGHQFEWAWILNEFEKAGGRPVGALISRLFYFAERYGVDPKTGLTYDQVSDKGRLLKGSFRSWPQTETLKALLAMGERSGRFDLDRIAEVTKNVLELYLAREPRGIWIDQLNCDREGTSTFTPSTTLYHIFLAFAELRRLEPLIQNQKP